MKQENLTQLLQPETAEAVLKEVIEILKLISPGFKIAVVHDVFNTASRIYSGKYPGYKACNTDYHDFAHVCAVFLAMARLSHGAVIDEVTFSQRHITLGLIAAMMHDVGYIQETHDRQGTGAKYTANHVQRSMIFLSRHGSEYGLSLNEIATARDIVRCTDLAADISAIGFRDRQTELLGKMLATADLLAQLADRLYLEKLLLLYHEYQEAEVGNYKGELDMLKNAVEFYHLFQERLNTKLDGVDRFMISHFTARWNIDKNLYHEEIERQKKYLLKILAIPNADPRDYLRRGGIVEKVRLNNKRKSNPGRVKTN